ncbi:hypothetical protein Tco_1427834 [Tanacetum coccineum]
MIKHRMHRFKKLNLSILFVLGYKKLVSLPHASLIIPMSIHFNHKVMITDGPEIITECAFPFQPQKSMISDGPRSSIRTNSWKIHHAIQTRRQLATDPELCMFARSHCSLEAVPGFFCLPTVAHSTFPIIINGYKYGISKWSTEGRGFFMLLSQKGSLIQIIQKKSPSKEALYGLKGKLHEPWTSDPPVPKRLSASSIDCALIKLTTNSKAPQETLIMQDCLETRKSQPSGGYVPGDKLVSWSQRNKTATGNVFSRDRIVNTGTMTKIELTLEQSQQGVSNDVLKPGQYICCQNHKLIADIENDIMDPVMQCTTLPSHSGFSQQKLVSFVTEIHTLSIDISLRDC